MSETSTALESRTSQHFNGERLKERNALPATETGVHAGKTFSEGDHRILHRKHSVSVEELGKLKLFVAALALLGCAVVLMRVESDMMQQLFKGLAIIAGLFLLMDLNSNTLKNQKR